DAYVRTFDRLGLPYVIVSAMSGAMGGSASEEFLAPIEVGADTFVRCPSCGYAANVEAYDTPAVPMADAPGLPPARVVDTPDTPTIATLVDHLNAHPDLRRADRAWEAADTLKNVLVVLRQPDGAREPLAVGVPGDREVDLKRLEAQVSPAEIEAFDDAAFAATPVLAKGYIGPGALGQASASGIRYLVDPRVADGTAWVTGADRDGHHVVGLVCGRDFTPDGTIDVADVRAGDTCPTCGHEVEIARGVEIGHIFQLGTKYADALGLQVLDQHGERVTVTMGSYGIGVSRAVAAIAECTHDELGLCWPPEIAPAHVHVVIAGKEGGPQRAVGERVAAELEAAGLRVLLDDREGVSPGVRFKDAELLGMPVIVVAGRGVDDGLLELRDRRTGERDDVAVADIVASVTSRLA
nr:His/Gly/Thr/Pro-type tRNA ligase C-terminal domain-containing protein [Ilumatobacteraceae bacterium]